MAGRKAPVIALHGEQTRQLEGLARAHSTPQQIALRARIILLAEAGLGVTAAAQQLGVWRKTVSAWRRRWLASPAGAPVAERLCDAPRPGAPASITPEQVCAIVALACEPPEASGIPITHWSQSALARQAVKRGLIEMISQRSVGRILKRSRPQAAPDARVAYPQA
jgi:transposase